MTIVEEFKKQVRTNAKAQLASWRKVDLHNHSPVSFDYQYKGTDVEDKIVSAILEQELSVVMFTDHNELPDAKLVENIFKRTGALILRGVEMNIFVEAHGKPNDKIDQDAYFHFLIGFDPHAELNPEWWLAHLKKEGEFKIKDRAGTPIGGLTKRIDDILKVLKAANAIVIPAHLHDQKGAFKARSIDEIYADKSFLQFVREFTALEVNDLKTATYFDGHHGETGNLFKNCIQSSDSHTPEDLGRRTTWVKMEKPSFAELKAALELPGRVQLSQLPMRSNWIEAVHVEGNFLQDTWLRLSSECNMFIAVKGSGKTSVLECLRFALDIKAPNSKQESVNRHLNHILGASGRVRVLIHRDDGHPAVVERRHNEQYATLHLDDGSAVTVDRPQVLGFHAQILGWNEIEDAANDPSTRRRYLDEIAGREQIDELDLKIGNFQTQVQSVHNSAHIEFNTYRSLRRQVSDLEAKQRKLQELQDGQQIELLNKYQKVASQYTSLQATILELEGSDQRAITSINNLYQRANIAPLRDASPISEALKPGLQHFDALNTEIDNKGREIAQAVTQRLELLRVEMGTVLKAKQEFDAHFDAEKSRLNPEQQDMLEKHRQVAEETSALPGLNSQLLSRTETLRTLLTQLTELSKALADTIETRTKIRQDAVNGLSARLEKDSVRLQLRPHQLHTYSDLVPNRQSAAQQFQRTVIQIGNPIWQKTLAQDYYKASQLYGEEFYNAAYDLLSDKDYHEFVRLVQDDDLYIEFEPHKGFGFKPITDLSAGQRCTAMFPILLNVGSGPLMIDQPEDNLDNRYISEVIAPALVREKAQRQLVFTSHNANLVVLSDSENIVAFESDGQYGKILNQGFLSTSASSIKDQVLGILDGGSKALRQRILKYGLRYE
jgi:hypothetical protein